jgi:hypothetical protein
VIAKHPCAENDAEEPKCRITRIISSRIFSSINRLIISLEKLFSPLGESAAVTAEEITFRD